MRTLEICPKCGDIKIKNMSTLTQCKFCNTPYIDTDEDDNDYSMAYLFDDDYELAELIEEKLYNKYVFNSPEFNQELFDERQREDKIQRHKWSMEASEKEEKQPRCPTCNSINVSKISAGQKVMGGVLFGLFSSNVRKSYQCKNCGYKR